MQRTQSTCKEGVSVRLVVLNPHPTQTQGNRLQTMRRYGYKYECYQLWYKKVALDVNSTSVT